MWRAGGVIAVALLLAGAEALAVGGEESREERIRRLTRQAMSLREIGRLDEAERVLAEAEQQLGADNASASGPGRAGVARETSLMPAGASEAQKPGKGDAAAAFTAGLAAVAKGNLAEAIAQFQRVVAIDPSSFEAYNNLAALYVEQGQDEEALQELRTALRLRPDYHRGRKNLAEVYARLARKAFLAAAETAPAEERPLLVARANSFDNAKVIAQAPGIAATPTAAPARPPAEAPVAQATLAAPVGTPPSESPSLQIPPQFVSLGSEGAHAIVIHADTLWVVEQREERLRVFARMPVRLAPGLPAQARLYVAAPGRGRISLVAIDGSADGVPPQIAAAGAVKEGVVLDQADIDRLTAMVRPFLTPVLIAPAVESAEPGRNAGMQAAVKAAFETWREAWAAKRIDQYVASYVAGYAAKGLASHEAWKQQRAGVFSRAKDIKIDLTPPAVLWVGDGVVTLTQQRYESNTMTSTGVKRMSWTMTSEGWRISAEEMLSEHVAPAEKRD